MLIGMGIFEYTIHIKASDQALSELYSRAFTIRISFSL